MQIEDTFRDDLNDVVIEEAVEEKRSDYSSLNYNSVMSCGLYNTKVRDSVNTLPEFV